jgi:hypothetical protein
MKIIQLLLVSCLLTQCALFQTAGTFDPNKAVTVIQLTIPSATRIGVSKEPKAEKYLLAVAGAIDTFSQGSTFDPASLQLVIEAAGMKELKTVQAQGVIDSVMALYKSFYAEAVTAKLDEKKLLPVLQALSAAIKKGLL